MLDEKVGRRWQDVGRQDNRTYDVRVHDRTTGQHDVGRQGAGRQGAGQDGRTDGRKSSNGRKLSVDGSRSTDRSPWTEVPRTEVQLTSDV